MFLDILNDRVIIIFLAYFIAFPLILLIPFYFSLYTLKRKLLRTIPELINSELDQKLSNIANARIGEIVDMSVDRLIDSSVYKIIEQKNSMLIEKSKDVIVKNISKLAYANLRNVVSELLPSITTQELKELLKKVPTEAIAQIIEKKLGGLTNPSFQEIVDTEIKNYISSLNIANSNRTKEYNEMKTERTAPSSAL